jgi:hypothetical protein
MLSRTPVVIRVALTNADKRSNILTSRMCNDAHALFRDSDYSFIATRCLQELSNQNNESFPRESEIIRKRRFINGI